MSRITHSEPGLPMVFAAIFWPLRAQPSLHTYQYVFIPRAPLTHFNDRRVRRIILGLTFWPKGIFWESMKDARIFLGRENNTGIFLGIVFFISSN